MGRWTAIVLDPAAVDRIPGLFDDVSSEDITRAIFAAVGLVQGRGHEPNTEVPDAD